MKVKPEIVPATVDHIQVIADHTREADRAELWAAACHTPQRALESSLALSEMAWTGLIDGVPVCMFGVVPATILGNVGRPWMIGTDYLDRFPFVFLRRCKTCVDNMRERFATLENSVDSRNVRAIEWLRWLGFSFSEPEITGQSRIPFIRFTMQGRL